MQTFITSEIFIKELNQASVSYDDLYISSRVFGMKNNGSKKPKLYKAQTFEKPDHSWIKSQNIEMVFADFYTRNLTSDEHGVS